MKERGVALCPTLAAGDAIARYGGWKKGIDSEPDSHCGKAGFFQTGIGFRGDHCFWRRRGCVFPWRELSGNGTDGRLWNVAHGGHKGRDLGECWGFSSGNSWVNWKKITWQT